MPSTVPAMVGSKPVAAHGAFQQEHLAAGGAELGDIAGRRIARGGDEHGCLAGSSYKAAAERRARVIVDDDA